MGSWKKAGKKALSRVREQAKADGMDDLFGGLDLKRIRDKKEQKAAQTLIKALQKNTEANKRKQAIAAFRDSVGDLAYRTVATAAKGTIKAMFSLLLVLYLGLSVGNAQLADGSSVGAPEATIEVLGTSEGAVRGPLDALGRFVQSQEAIVGLSVSPLDVTNLQLEGVTLLRGPAYGERGLSLLPDKHKPEAKPYVEIDYGGRFTKEEVNFRAMVGLHPANLTNVILRDWIKTDRLRIPPLPENLVGGPMFRIPLPGDPEKWGWENGFRLVLAYLFE